MLVRPDKLLKSASREKDTRVSLAEVSDPQLKFSRNFLGFIYLNK
jgi:hypothetical protein